jgi:hypothetical protein
MNEISFQPNEYVFFKIQSSSPTIKGVAPVGDIMLCSPSVCQDQETFEKTRKLRAQLFALNRRNKVPHASSRYAVSPEKLFHGTAAPGFISMHDCFPAAASGNELNCYACRNYGLLLTK